MLRPDTESVWNAVRNESSLRGFILVGGTALSIHLDHRVSEDLDFVWVNSLKLPKEQLDIFLKKMEKEGFSFERDDNDAAYDEFQIAGMELHDYQQDFAVNGSVKVSFFCGDDPTGKILGGKSDPEKPVVADVADLFEMKALLLSTRTKSRDWFDVYALLKNDTFTIADLRKAYLKHDLLGKFDSALEKVVAGKLPETDEGFEDLLENAPSLREISEFFEEQRDALEIQIAESAMRDRSK